MRDLLPEQQLLKELQEIFLLLKYNSPTATSTIFEDNAGAVELARCPKMRPGTKHIAIITTFVITLKRERHHSISTNDQIADFFTKPLPWEKSADDLNFYLTYIFLFLCMQFRPPFYKK